MSEMIQISINDDNVLSAIERLYQKAHHLRQPMDDIGNFLTNIMEDSFDSETAPDGQAWHPLADSTKKFKAKHGGYKILQSADRNTRESTGYLADDMSVIVGVNAYSKDEYPYPIVHQFGTEDGKIEARPFMPITSEGELYDNVDVEVMDIILGYLSE